jgi:hypothetical protein
LNFFDPLKFIAPGSARLRRSRVESASVVQVRHDDIEGERFVADEDVPVARRRMKTTGPPPHRQLAAERRRWLARKGVNLSTLIRLRHLTT